MGSALAARHSRWDVRSCRRDPDTVAPYDIRFGRKPSGERSDLTVSSAIWGFGTGIAAGSMRRVAGLVELISRCASAEVKEMGGHASKKLGRRAMSCSAPVAAGGND